MKNVIIRNEKAEDYKEVEELTRKAFYNLYIPGCIEHYPVHTMRSHKDFIPELDFVLELDGKIIGNIMYTRAMLIDENEEEKEILTFGPVCIHPSYQRMGYGKLLISHSLAEASCLGYDTVVILGSPSNYVTMGFQSCRKHNVSLENGRYPAAMMVKELVPDALSGHRWIYKESPAMEVSEEEALAYDSTLEKMERKHTPSQEEFYIISSSFIE